jgi:hypothetical protein
MVKAEIFSGICGFTTFVDATMDGRSCNLEIKSECPSIQRLAEDLKQVDPYQEISRRPTLPQTFQAANKHCAHASCPVAVGIIKAIEVEAGLALPADVTIKITKLTG